MQRVFEIAKEKAHINKKATVHTLRHSFATHLLESGVDIYHIQQLMGHSNVKTTNMYIHLQRKDLLNIISPLDRLNGIE
jgi:site-specific recombinase XerD